MRIRFAVVGVQFFAKFPYSSLSCFFLHRTKIDGAWSKTGCTLVESTRDQTICSCNHLTNFAVLMEVGETKVPTFSMCKDRKLLCTEILIKLSI